MAKYVESLLIREQLPEAHTAASQECSLVVLKDVGPTSSQEPC